MGVGGWGACCGVVRMVWCCGGFGDGSRTEGSNARGDEITDACLTSPQRKKTRIPQVDTFNIYDGAAAHLLKGDISPDELTQVGWC